MQLAVALVAESVRMVVIHHAQDHVNHHLPHPHVVDARLLVLHHAREHPHPHLVMGVQTRARLVVMEHPRLLRVLDVQILALEIVQSNVEVVVVHVLEIVTKLVRDHAIQGVR